MKGGCRGVVAAGHELTAATAQSVLRDGGNAYDAALAGLAAACVAEPVLSSLGGGGFMLARPAGEAPRLYDFFVQTPSRRRPEDELDFGPIVADFGTAQQVFHIGLGSVAVPGLVKGMFEAHADLGRMPVRDVLAPAVALARDGVVVNELHAYILQVVQAIYRHTPGALAVYGGPEGDGKLVGHGDRLRQPELAEVLDCLAAEGADLFYRGEIGQLIVSEMHGGGQLTAADLAGYRVARRAPLTVDYGGARLYTNPPPSSGGILIGFGLRLLDGIDLVGPGFGSAGHLLELANTLQATTQVRVEARAGGAASASDPLDPALVERYRAQVAGRRRANRGTTHVSVLDGAGNIASLTVSNGEGCGHVVPGTGIMLNNMLGEEDLNPGGFHRWPAGQRMTSMMAPTVVTTADGRVIATGSGGSNRIRSAVLQVLLNLLDFHMPVEDAVRAPRIHMEPDLLSVEGGFPADGVRSLVEAYPESQVWDALNLFFGGAHTVVHDGKSFQGAGDLRRGGVCVVA